LLHSCRSEIIPFIVSKQEKLRKYCNKFISHGGSRHEDGSYHSAIVKTYKNEYIFTFLAN